MENLYDNDKQSRKNNKLNISQFTRDLETKLINLQNNDIIVNESNEIVELNYGEPLPSNMSKNMIETVNNQNLKRSEISIDDHNQHNNIYNNDIIIYTLLFILLNHNFVITFINYNINDNTNTNLIIRSLLFLLLLYLIKKNL
uniref:Uncharacterized protein n=1 Tax=viral metagenome TaxID=1070528 RepID=A0A6C0EC17_9ZZZZ